MSNSQLNLDQNGYSTILVLFIKKCVCQYKLCKKSNIVVFTLFVVCNIVVLHQDKVFALNYSYIISQYILYKILVPIYCCTVYLVTKLTTKYFVKSCNTAKMKANFFYFSATMAGLKTVFNFVYIGPI